MSGDIEAEDRAFLEQAVGLSWTALKRGEGRPFGAVVAMDGRIIGEGRNRIAATGDPTAHAEMEAIRQACESVGPDLTGATMYASGEPCPMCLGAMYLTRVSRCFYATTKEEAARMGSLSEMIYGEFAKPPAERAIPCVHVPMPRASEAFDEWLAQPQ